MVERPCFFYRSMRIDLIEKAIGQQLTLAIQWHGDFEGIISSPPSLHYYHCGAYKRP